MRKRLAVLLASLAAAVVLLPAAPAAATTCYIEDPPGVDDVRCMLYGTPSWELCHKLRVC